MLISVENLFITYMYYLHTVNIYKCLLNKTFNSLIQSLIFLIIELSIYYNVVIYDINISVMLRENYTSILLFISILENLSLLCWFFYTIYLTIDTVLSFMSIFLPKKIKH